MTNLFDKLNLNAQERRLVVITGIVVFALLNWFFVFPEFGEYGKYEQRIKDAAAKLKSYQDEIARRPGDIPVCGGKTDFALLYEMDFIGFDIRHKERHRPLAAADTQLNARARC